MSPQAILGLAAINVLGSPVPDDAASGDVEPAGLEVEEFVARDDVPCMGGSFRRCHEISLGMCPYKCNGPPRRRYLCTGRCITDATLNCQKHCH